MKQTSVTIMVAMVTVTMLPSCSTFLLADNCPAPSPCTCSGSSSSYSYIYCNWKSLKETPHFHQSENHVTTLGVYLYGNSITVIHDNAFSNLSSINATNVDLEINNNNIHTIESNAFNGIENITTSLQLSSNNLTTLPAAIGKLIRLKSLNLYSNPIHALDSSVMSKIGRSLTYLYLDMKYFAQWPDELHYLTGLQTLIAQYIPFTHLDINAFHGFENTLTQLQLLNSKLEKVPYSICNLNRLTTLYFNSGSHLTENRSTIFESCSRKLISITTLHLSANGLHTFPDVFTLFPSLKTLFLDNNQLEYIDSAVIRSNANLTTINLDYNMFERIPSPLKKLKSLETISLENNNIKTIELADLYGLSMLRDLKLYRNPIVYISSNAFKHNPNLNTLDIRYTHLDLVPAAVIYLPNLRTLYLSGRPIDCTCDMAYLKHWNATAVRTFDTKCASSSETIKTFLVNSLQSCP